jgi:hypothetical protein
MQLCLYTSINVTGWSSNVTDMMGRMDYGSIGNMNFAIFFFVSNSLDLIGSQMLSVSVAAISLGNVSVIDSLVNTSARSCPANSGRGRGTNIQYQNTYCTSGSSSCGYGAISNAALCSNVVEYFMFLSHSLPYISKGPFLSTGSGGYGYSSDKDAMRGAGGGIVFILADDTLAVDTSYMEAAGGSVGVEDQLSAGSGGTVFVSSQTLYSYGFSYISVEGGNSSNNNGSGAGGMVKMSYTNYPNRGSRSEDSDNVLWVNVNSGIQQNNGDTLVYTNGIFYGPTCLPGQQAKFLGCDSCPPGYYSSLGDPICRACPPVAQVNFDNSSTGN